MRHAAAAGLGAAAVSPLPAGRTWIVLDGRQTCAVSGWLGADRCRCAATVDSLPSLPSTSVLLFTPASSGMRMRTLPVHPSPASSGAHTPALPILDLPNLPRIARACTAAHCSAATEGTLTLKKPAGGAYTTWHLEAAPGQGAPAPGADLSGLRVTLRLEGRAGAPHESCASYLAPASATSCANTGVTLSATPGVWVLEAVNGEFGRYRLRANVSQRRVWLLAGHVKAWHCSWCLVEYAMWACRPTPPPPPNHTPGGVFFLSTFLSFTALLDPCSTPLQRPCRAGPPCVLPPLPGRLEGLH